MDGIPAGSFGDWRTGFEQNWRADIGGKLTAKEKSEYKRKIDIISRERMIEEKKLHTNAQEQALPKWEKATESAGNHSYLVRKGIKGYGLREYEDKLLIPVINDEILYSLQSIDSNGNKQFLFVGRVNGCYFGIGKPKDVICICEGYATGASIFEATGYPVAVAFYAGNLKPVAQVLHQKFPKVKFIVCADDDIGVAGNPG